ncbi:MAG: sulfotransferase family protein [Syntrophobacteraceae bacterium]
MANLNEDLVILEQSLTRTKRPIAVILGMHRSGTSLLANFLHAIGVDLGQDLLGADEWNAAGYWESRNIQSIHEKILAELSCSWDNPPLSFHADWFFRPRIQELKKELIEFVGSECNRTEKILGFKDPRTAFFLPLWKEIFDELQLEPLYLLAIREPGSVVASLKTRDQLGTFHAQVLWLKAYLEVISHTQDELRMIVDYDRWFDAGMDQARKIVKSLNLSETLSNEKIENALNQTIRPELRHHLSNKIECSPIVENFYSLLSRGATNAKMPDEVGEIIATFKGSMEILSIWDECARDIESESAEREKKIVTICEATEEQYTVFKARSRKQRKYLTVALITSILFMIILLITGTHLFCK